MEWKRLIQDLPCVYISDAGSLPWLRTVYISGWTRFDSDLSAFSLLPNFYLQRKKSTANVNNLKHYCLSGVMTAIDKSFYIVHKNKLTVEAKKTKTKKIVIGIRTESSSYVFSLAL